MAAIDDMKLAVQAMHETEQRTLVILDQLAAGVSPTDPVLVGLVAQLKSDVIELTAKLDSIATPAPAPTPGRPVPAPAPVHSPAVASFLAQPGTGRTFP